MKIFDNEESFWKEIEEKDPMKDFVATNRKINWSPIEKECISCKKKFIAKHPAKRLCDSCIDNDNRSKKSTVVTDSLKKNKITRECESCRSLFYLTAPAMKLCENCSITGGKLVPRAW